MSPVPKDAAPTAGTRGRRAKEGSQIELLILKKRLESKILQVRDGWWAVRGQTEAVGLEKTVTLNEGINPHQFKRIPDSLPRGRVLLMQPSRHSGCLLLFFLKPFLGSHITATQRP